jgi:phage portal protein BeeE
MTTVPIPISLAPEAVIVQLRTIQSQIAGVTPLTQAQRTQLKQRLRAHSKSVVDASINVIGVLDNVSQAIGQPLDEVRQLQDDTLRWEAAADEARAFLKGIEGANLVRRERLALIATQAYTIGSQLARDPAKAVLVPHLEEVKRLKGVSRRRRAAPVTPPTPTGDSSTAPKGVK